MSAKLIGVFGVLLLSILLSACTGGRGTPAVGYNNGYQPQQPIPFKHSLHAGQYQIPCQYCHSAVEKSKHATVPSLNVCMNCHTVVKADSPWIQQMRKAYDSGQSIPWQKVTLLPDHVMFNHKRHVAKNVACQHCHGAVENMDTVYQHSSLKMGWCVNCHRQPEHNAPITCSTCHY